MLPMKRLILSGVFCALSAAAMAGTTLSGENTRLKSLETTDAGRDWEAVGRLDRKGEGFCTGALIAPDIVLTAAHCLYDRDTMEQIAY